MDEMFDSGGELVDEIIDDLRDDTETDENYEILEEFIISEENEVIEQTPTFEEVLIVEEPMDFVSQEEFVATEYFEDSKFVEITNEVEPHIEEQAIIVDLPSYEEVETQLDAFLEKIVEEIESKEITEEYNDEESQELEWDALLLSEQNDNDIPSVEEGEQLNDYRNLDTWLKDINPNFDPYDVESPYCNNCGSCAYAVYRRLEGDTEIVATADNIGYNDEMTALTGMEQVSMSPAEIEARLLEQGDGAHAIIGIDRSSGPGHWFNAICKDGKVYAVDGQTGEINEWPPDYGDVVNWEMSIKECDL